MTVTSALTQSPTDAQSPPVLLLDRDGVLNRDRPNYVLNTQQLVMLPGAIEAVARLKRAGWTILVITNQACIGRGLLTEDELQTIHQSLQTSLKSGGGSIDQFYYCPHHPDAGCTCRKPLPGLIEQARKAWHFNPQKTWLVGDAVRDMQAAEAAQCRATLVATGKGAASAKERPDLPLFDDLAHFAEHLLNGNINNTG